MKVSVIMSTYNRAGKELPRAIASVITQTFTDWELLVVDDGSSDGTDEVVRHFNAEDSRVKYLRNKKNFGKDTRPKNLGIIASQGQYIAYLDDDNEWLPNHLDLLVTELDMSPNMAAVYGDFRVIDETHPDAEPRPGISSDFDAQLLLNRCYIDTSSVVHRREAVIQVGGWDETLPRFVDWNLWVRMAKAGCQFKRVPIYLTKYYITPGNTAETQPVKTWTDQHTGWTFFDPTWFDPAGCYVYGPWLGKLDKTFIQKREVKPKVAIFTITYGRLEYTQRMFASMLAGTKYLFDWFVFDNGSKDGTKDWLLADPHSLRIPSSGLTTSSDNKGLTIASNRCLDMIEEAGKYDIIIKVDNDCEFLTKGWLETFVDLWQRNHNLYIGPYPEGLVHNPGGAPRLGQAEIGPHFVEVTNHVSGLCVAADAVMYKGWRWEDQFLHGSQDVEASNHARSLGFMPMIAAQVRVWHIDGTTGQHKKFKKYFEKRKKEKTQTYAKKTRHHV